MPAGWLGEVNTVVWRVAATRPPGYRNPDALSRPAEADSVGEFSVTRGLTLWGVHADDSYPDGTDYAAWRFKVPASVHTDADSSGIPRRITEVMAHLQQRYPALTDWQTAVDESLTWSLFGSEVLLSVYADLIRAIEVALLPLQTREAARVDAMTHSWATAMAGGEGRIIGTYSLPVASQQTPNGWLLVNAGIADPSALDRDDDAARAARRMGVLPDQPLLVVPRPENPVFFAQVSPGVGHGGVTKFLREPQPRFSPAVASEHRWLSRSPEQLAGAVQRASSVWLNS